MAIIKCKMCGGDIELSADKTFGTCDSCGSSMTFPKVDDEQRAAAFNRGNHFRRIGEFDKALQVYERIVREDNTDAEAHWCCALCRFGIEYVEDPVSYEWLPTCHRASFDSFLEDVDYLAAVEYSDGITRRQYQKDGMKIAEVQRGILATSQNAEPYDVFICYKESDADGGRTKDSMLAQDIYYQLTEQGRKVFFSRITLEDVAGTQYEPYIFAALNSAKVMIVVGTKPEHLNAVWVKNEWSRFLAMMKKDHSKLLLPCYRDMDPYDLPEHLSVLQSYDMGKIGFIQDLIRGVSKVLDADKKPVKETVVVQSAGNSNTAPLLKRIAIFLDDQDWQSANEYCEKVLDIDPENGEAYLGKLMAELRVRKKEDLKDLANPFNQGLNYEKTIRFGSSELKQELGGYIQHIENRNLEKHHSDLYSNARNLMRTAKDTDAESFNRARSILQKLPKDYKDAGEQIEICKKRAAECGYNQIYEKAKRLMQTDTIDGYRSAIQTFKQVSGWKDAAAQIETCNTRIEELKKQQEEAAEEKKKRIKFISIGAASFVVVALIVTLIFTVIIPAVKYDKAVKLLAAGENQEAIPLLMDAAGYKDASDLLRQILSQQKTTLVAGNNYTVGLRSDGTVVTVGTNDGGRCDVLALTNIVAISAGEYHTVGLKSDGTVVAVGANAYGQCDVSGWTDIIAVSAGKNHTVGLKSNGTVVAVGRDADGRCDVSGWTDIVAVSAGGYHTVGLKADGTVVAVGYNFKGQCDVSDWKGIVAISAGLDHTVGLKSDGTVVAVGANNYEQCDVSGWTDIFAISAGSNHTVGLKADGTVVAAGWNNCGQCDVSGWKDVVAVSTGYYHTVGLKADGTVIAVGNDEYGQCDVSDWKDIKQP